jgi:hypothetical protein
LSLIWEPQKLGGLGPSLAVAPQSVVVVVVVVVEEVVVVVVEVVIVK